MEFPTAAGPVVLHDVLDVAALVAYLRRPSRSRPVVVLTVAPGQVTPYVGANAVARAGGGRVDVATIPTDALTHTFTGSLSDARAGVYQGACRVYPPGTEWEGDPFSVPLRMARNSGEVMALPAALLRDVKEAVELAARPAPAPRRPEGPTRGLGLPTPPVAAAPRLVPPPGEVASPADADLLARYLRSPARTAPVVVVSRATGAPGAYADADRLRADLAGMADVFEIVGLEASWAFSRAVPEMCQVYGGASRVYPVGTEWERDPFLSPLRFAYSRADREPVTRQLVADVLGMASRGQLTLPAGALEAKHVKGEVEGVVGDRAVVRLPGQFPGVVWPELVEPGLPAERLFAKRMRVEGVLDPVSRRIDVRDMRQAPLDAVAGYQAGSTILVRVASVSAEACTVELFPGLQIGVAADLVVEDEADLRELMVVGEVLPAWFGGRDESTGEWLLSLQDAADPGEAVPAASVLVGGPPWLAPTRPEPAQPTEGGVEPASEQRVTAEPSAAFVEALQRDKDQLVTELKAARIRSQLLQAQLDTMRPKLRDLMRRRSRVGGSEPDDTRLFDNETEQLDFEIRLAWARMTEPGEKRDRPLKKWSYSEHFFDSVHAVEGIAREKIVEVIVQVLTGRDVELASRERHPLRTGKGGDDPVVLRDRQERCWRVSLQTNTPSARRLHYWTCADGSIELSSIRLHDDFRP